MADDDTAPVPEAFANAELPKPAAPPVPDSAKDTDGENGAEDKNKKDSSTSTTGKDTTSGVPVGKLLGWAVPVLGLTAGVAMYNQSPILAAIVFFLAFLLASAFLARHLHNKRAASRADKTAVEAPRAARPPRQRGEPGRFNPFRNLFGRGGGGGRGPGRGDRTGSLGGGGKSGGPGGGGGRWWPFKNRAGGNPSTSNLSGSKPAGGGKGGKPGSAGAQSPLGTKDKPPAKAAAANSGATNATGNTRMFPFSFKRRPKAPGEGTSPAGGGPGKKKPAAGSPGGGGSTSSTTSTGSRWNPLKKRRKSTGDGDKRSPKDRKPKDKTSDGGPNSAPVKGKEDAPAKGGKKARWWNPLSWGSTTKRDDAGSADTGTGTEMPNSGSEAKENPDERKDAKATKGGKKEKQKARRANKAAETDELLAQLGPLDPSGFALHERLATPPADKKKSDSDPSRPAKKSPAAGTTPAAVESTVRVVGTEDPPKPKAKTKAEPASGTDDGGFFAQSATPSAGKPDPTADNSAKQPAVDDGGFPPYTPAPSGKETTKNRGTGITVATITNAKSSPINTNSTTTTREFSVATVAEYANRLDVSSPLRLKQSLFDIADKARADAKEKDELAEDLKAAAAGLGNKVGYMDDSVDLAVEARKTEEDAAERRAMAIVFTNKAHEIKVS